MILLSTLLIPLIAILIISISPEENKKFFAYLLTGSLLYSFVVYMYMLFTYSTLYFEVLYGYVSSIGYFGLIYDGFNAPFLLGIALVSSIVALYSLPYMEHRFHELGGGSWRSYYVNYGLFSVSMLGVALSSNMIEFYIFLEISLITSFILLALYGYGDRIRIGIMYFIWTHVGALLFLIGSFIYGLNAGSFDFIVPYKPYYMTGRGYEVLAPLGLQVIVFILIFLGLMIKLPGFGFHIWLPYAHAEAPTPVSALLSPNLIGLAALGMLRILVTLFPQIFYLMQNMIIVWALITIIYGGLVALYQSDYKRFLAYSSISQMGYILLGLATLTPAGVLGAVLHYLTHALGKASLFMTAGNIIISGNELRDINKMGGLASSMNKTAGSALLGFLSISGLPPTVGIISKFLIVAGFASYVITGFSNIYLMAILILTAFIGFGLTLVYSFHTMRRIFFGLRRSDIEVSEAPSMASLSTFVLAIFSIIFLILAGYLINQAHYSSDFMKIILMMR
jgi:NADH-quinone oxidoreductase subunit M